MSEERIKQLMSELVSELEKTNGVNEETLADAKKLNQDLADLTNPDIDTTEHTILDDAIALEASFAATHPTAEKIVRELINSLSRIGI